MMHDMIIDWNVEREDLTQVCELWKSLKEDRE